MQKLTYQAKRPFLDPNIVRIIGNGELPAGVRAHFRYLLPGDNGLPRLKTVFEELPGNHAEVQVPCQIEAEFELSTAYNQMLILGEDNDITLELPAIFTSTKGGGEVPSL